ncbi:MAG TPA: NADH-ubiquinone oxidoreductase-F iron-sulfur binding region domain-containing protein [Candidatus Limnocylindrales bacterium]|nr:NADH-ubiquinone oxidoreductase-F iron-sulfur binding region domain-containing protein [Candidatus Limnocylindrales bacterium]
MDIKVAGETATAEEREAVDDVLGPPRSGWTGGAPSPMDQRVALGGRQARAQRHLLLPTLHAIQDRVGYCSHGAVNYLCERLTIPPAEAYAVASGYALLALEPRPARVVHVCDDLACRMAGADRLCDELGRRLGPEGSGGGSGGSTWMRSPCLGRCDTPVAALVQQAGDRRQRSEVSVGALSVEEALRLLTPPYPDPPPPGGRDIVVEGSPLRLLGRVGVVDPDDLSSYRAHGGYAALRRAVALGQEAVIREVQDARLLGRGGAAFPTGRKWDAVARAPERPHYLVCNADESEPGTFKDRVLMEADPFAVLEAMTIAAFASGCERGYLYVRGEYPLARRRIDNAIAQAREHGFLGEDVLGRGFAFDVEVRRGAGAYICGEETALFNSIEGKRAEPRNKPPFPTAVGLFGKPTLVNNVETLVNVLEIIERGAGAFAAVGTAESTGTRLFCLSGSIERPGLYEAPMGITLRELLERAGGVRGRLRTVLLGGAAGSFTAPDQLDVPLSFEGTRACGLTLGSGVVMPIDDEADLNGFVLRIARFFRDESCGQCVPCRVGTVRQEEALLRLIHGRLDGERDGQMALLRDVAQVMRDASICGLGQTAGSAAESAIRLNLLAARGSAPA